MLGKAGHSVTVTTKVTEEVAAESHDNQKEGGATDSSDSDGSDSDGSDDSDNSDSDHSE